MKPVTEMNAEEFEKSFFEAATRWNNTIPSQRDKNWEVWHRHIAEFSVRLRERDAAKRITGEECPYSAATYDYDMGWEMCCSKIRLAMSSAAARKEG